jgi:hypothetical protein
LRLTTGNAVPWLQNVMQHVPMMQQLKVRCLQQPQGMPHVTGQRHVMQHATAQR